MNWASCPDADTYLRTRCRLPPVCYAVCGWNWSSRRTRVFRRCIRSCYL